MTRVSVATTGTFSRCYSVARSRWPLGFISLIFSIYAPRPDPHASHLLCFGIRGATSKEYVAGNNRPRIWQQCVVAANISWDFRIGIILKPERKQQQLAKMPSISSWSLSL